MCFSLCLHAPQFQGFISPACFRFSLFFSQCFKVEFALFVSFKMGVHCYNFPVSTALVAFRKLWYVAFLFSYISTDFLIYLVIFSLTHWSNLWSAFISTHFLLFQIFVTYLQLHSIVTKQQTFYFNTFAFMEACFVLWHIICLGEYSMRASELCCWCVNAL